MDEIETPWENPKDFLDRKEYAEFLTGYLCNKQDPFVLNINARWGSGKTYFLTHWRESIKTRYPTVYVNAWESDFSDDPLVAVISAIHEQIVEHLPEKEQTRKAFTNRLKSAGRFVRGLAPVITKGLVHKALGEEAGKEIVESLPVTDEDIENVAQKSMELLLEDHETKKGSILEFKIALAKLVSDVTEGDLEPPLFLFIDELDRCRPTYAIELLEIVKHLFSVDRVIFVIATDSEQLQHSIKAIYGNDFDGGEYLRRFFEQEYVLPSPDYLAYCKFITNDFHYSDKLMFENFQPWNLNNEFQPKPNGWEAKESLSSFLGFYSKHYDLSLRSVNQVVVRLEAVLGSSEEKIWDGPFLLLLLVLQAKDSSSITWIRENLLKGMIFADINKDMLRQKLIIGGDTMRRFYDAMKHYGEPAFDEQWSVERIAREYISSMHTLRLLDDKDKLYEFCKPPTSLASYIMNNLANSKLNSDYNQIDISLYFDHVEMAGALT
ncbi:MAG: P-loop NTPase fold protein [Gammaproteobacteria bacterium]